MASLRERERERERQRMRERETENERESFMASLSEKGIKKNQNCVCV